MPELPSTGDRWDGDVLVPVLLAVFVIVVTAFLATVVLDMGQDRSSDLAGASVQFDSGTDAIGVTFTSMSRPGTTLDVSVEDADGGGMVATATLSGVGWDQTFNGLEDGRAYRVVVVADWNGGRSVVTIRSGQL